MSVTFSVEDGVFECSWNNEPFGSSDAENYVFLPLCLTSR